MKRWNRRIGVVLGVMVLGGCGGKRGDAPAAAGRPASGNPKTSSSAGLSGKTLKVTVMDIGQGDSTLIETPGGKTILIDAGLPGSQEKIEPILQAHHIARLDFVVDSHPHNDHIGGMGKLLGDVPFGIVYDSGMVTNSPAQTRLLRAIQQTGGRLIKARAGDKVEIDRDVTMEILAPQDPLYTEHEKSGINNNSVVVRFVFGKTRLLFTGDMEEEERGRLYESGADLHADFLKAAHHGSRNGTDAEFLSKVKPQLATISCATGNDYGHPHQEALETFQAAKVPIYRTDLSGSITILCDNQEHLQVQPVQIAEESRVYAPGDDRREQKKHRKKGRRSEN